MMRARSRLSPTGKPLHAACTRRSQHLDSKAIDVAAGTSTAAPANTPGYTRAANAGYTAVAHAARVGARGDRRASAGAPAEAGSARSCLRTGSSFNASAALAWATRTTGLSRVRDHR